MTGKHTPIYEDIQLPVLRRLQETPEISQRALARELGVSVGSINFCIKALMEKGWVKIMDFSRNTHKLGYVYLLTPSGIRQKSHLAASFLQRKLIEYEALQREIAQLQAEVQTEEFSRSRAERIQ